MQTEPQAADDFEKMDDEQDPMVSMKNTKKMTNDFRDKRCVFGSMWQAQKQPHNCTQREDEDVKKHDNRFKNHVEIIENYGGDLFRGEQFMLNDKKCKNMSETNKKKTENKEAAQERNREVSSLWFLG